MAYICETCRLYRKESFVCPRCGREAMLSYHRGNDLLQLGYEECKEDDVPATGKNGRVGAWNLGGGNTEPAHRPVPEATSRTAPGPAASGSTPFFSSGRSESGASRGTAEPVRPSVRTVSNGSSSGTGETPFFTPGSGSRNTSGPTGATRVPPAGRGGPNEAGTGRPTVNGGRPWSLLEFFAWFRRHAILSRLIHLLLIGALIAGVLYLWNNRENIFNSVLGTVSALLPSVLTIGLMIYLLIRMIWPRR